MHFYLFFLSVMVTQKGNLDTKNGVDYDSNIPFHIKIWFSYFIKLGLKIIYFPKWPRQNISFQSFLMFDKEIEENKQILKNLIEKIWWEAHGF